jgi:hypothetical protein
MNLSRLVWGVVAILLLPLASTAQETYPVFFVSPTGNDAWSGLLSDPDATQNDGPFQTPQRALEALRAVAAEDGHANGAVIYLREGSYALTEPLTFGPKDSGREHRPVLFRNFKNEAVRIHGGVPVMGLEPHENGILKTTVGNDRPAAVYWNGKRLPLARWPNAGGGDLPGGEWTFIKGSDDSARSRRFLYTGDRPKQWEGQSGIEVSIWPNYNWWQTIAPVKSIADGAVELEADLPYTIEEGRRLFYQNIRAELDAPGEWWHDPTDGTLYIIPPKEDPQGEVMIATASSLLRVEGASHVNLLGFTLEMATGEAVVMKDAHACMLAKSTIRHTDGFGVIVSGGGHCRILGNDIYETGRGGIDLTGGDRKTLAGGNHQAINNHIHHFGVLYQTYQTGVNVNGVGNTVSHNLIHDAPHIGVLLTGNEHIIEYNEIHHVCLQGSDNGGFYMGRDWTQRGNKIRYNKFHDIYGFGLNGKTYESPHQAWAVYLDDCSSGTTIHGNLFYRVPLCGVMIGGGRDNAITNNVFVDCVPALHIDDRWDEYPWEVMHERLLAMNPSEPPYSERYPELLKMGDDPRKPENNRFERNIVTFQNDSFRGLSTTARHPEGAVVYDFDQFDPASTVIDENVIFHHDQPLRVAWSEYGKADSYETLDWEEWMAKGFDANSIVGDPLFVDPERDDYSLQPKSPAEKIKFEKIPAHRIGLIEDEFRVSPIPPRDERTDGAMHTSYPVPEE